MSEINKRIEALEAELQKLKQEVKPTFEVGKWYKSDTGGLWFITEFKGLNHQVSYGFNRKRDWVHEDNRHSSGLTLATDKEVEEALINEAKKKIKGNYTSVRKVQKNEVFTRHGSLSSVCSELDGKLGSLFWYNPHTDTLYNYGLGLYIVYEKGKWAEIVESKLTICGHEVEKISNEGFKIGCKNVCKTELSVLKNLMQPNNFTTVQFDEYEVTLEEINKILEL